MKYIEGYFRIHRKLMSHPIWQNSNPAHKVILIAILSLAGYKSEQWEWNGRPYCCDAGEFISSYAKIAERCGKGISIQQVRDALKRFKKFEFLSWEAGKQRTDGIKVSILKWREYQAYEYD